MEGWRLISPPEKSRVCDCRRVCARYDIFDARSGEGGEVQTGEVQTGRRESDDSMRVRLLRGPGRLG